jgi:hypothetical protein
MAAHVLLGECKLGMTLPKAIALSDARSSTSIVIAPE